MAEDKASAVAGATSVAEAVKRVADAAVAAAQRVPESGPQEDFRFAGAAPGGRFTIDGMGFSSGGTVTVGGVQAKTTSWSVNRIIGIIPDKVTKGPVVVKIDDKTQFNGYFR